MDWGWLDAISTFPFSHGIDSWRLTIRGPVRGGIGLGLLLLIFSLAVHLPQVISRTHDISCRLHCCNHGMVLIVVAKHPVASYQLEVGEVRFYVGPNCGHVLL